MRIHFIAIGGYAMHSLALALQEKGDLITGSDDVIFDPSKSRLEEAGLLPEKFGWFPEKITDDIDAIVLGMHAKPDNPELKAAQKMGLKIYSYPEFLYEQGKDKTRVVIGGSHGKTTITSMILHVLHYWKKEVDFMVGAQLKELDNLVKLTADNPYMVLEGDEYLSSPIDRRPKFHHYHADIALLSGIAWDHINVFPTFANYVQQFKDFIGTMSTGGVLIYNEEDPILRKVVHESTHPVEKIGYRLPEYRVSDGKTILLAKSGPLPIAVFGEHNLRNLAGAMKVCSFMGISTTAFYEAISTFKGAAKRLEKIAEKGNTLVFKDYAHSPSKVEAVTKAVKKQFPDRKLLACLELHTYSSLNAEFLTHYRHTLDAADEALVFYSPEAVKIKCLEKIESDQIKEAFGYEGLQVYTDSESFQKALKKKDLKNTVLLLMSSGTYGGLDLEHLSQWI